MSDQMKKLKMLVAIIEAKMVEERSARQLAVTNKIGRRVNRQLQKHILRMDMGQI